MTIHLPPDIESSIQAAIHGGHFASVDDAISEAARLPLQTLQRNPRAATPIDQELKPDPLLGSMKDHAELIDQIVEDAMMNRQEEASRQEL
jgi:Arc/MetJ-type ribon-helix-helix transcriptional regulator